MEENKNATEAGQDNDNDDSSTRNAKTTEKSLRGWQLYIFLGSPKLRVHSRHKRKTSRFSLLCGRRRTRLTELFSHAVCNHSVAPIVVDLPHADYAIEHALRDRSPVRLIRISSQPRYRLYSRNAWGHRSDSRRRLQG